MVCGTLGTLLVSGTLPASRITCAMKSCRYDIGCARRSTSGMDPTRAWNGSYERVSGL